MRSFSTLLIITLSAVCLSCTPEQIKQQFLSNASELTIVVNDHQGQPVNNSAIWYKPTYFDEQATYVPVQADASSTLITLADEGYYDIYISVPGHRRFRFLHRQSSTSHKVLTIHMPALSYKPNNITATVYDADNQSSSHTLKPKGNGLYRAEIDAKPGTYHYVLSGLLGGLYKYANPQGERFSVREESYFHYTDIDSKDNQLIIQIDIGSNHRINPVPPSFEFAGDWQDLERDTIASSAALFDYLTLTNIESNNTSKEALELPAAESLIKRLIKQYPNTQSGFYEVYRALLTQSPNDYENALNSIRADSPVWSFPKIAFGDFLIGSVPESEIVSEPRRFLAGKAKFSELVEALYETNQNDQTKADLLFWEGWAYKETSQFTELEKINRRLNMQYQHVPSVQWYKEQLTPPKLPVGTTIPFFELADLDSGSTLTPKSFDGKYLLIDFWATWCAPCREEMPKLHDLYAKYNSSGLEILSISGDENLEAVESFRDQFFPMPWKHHFMGSPVAELTNTFDIVGYPQAYLVSPNGNIVARGHALRGENLEVTLTKFITFE